MLIIHKKIIDSKWFQLPVCAFLLLVVMHLGDLLWQSPQVEQLNQFYPSFLILIIYGVCALVSAAFYYKVHLKYCIGYMLLLAAMLLLLNGMVMTDSILHPTAQQSADGGRGQKIHLTLSGHREAEIDALPWSALGLGAWQWVVDFSHYRQPGKKLLLRQIGKKTPQYIQGLEAQEAQDRAATEEAVKQTQSRMNSSLSHGLRRGKEFINQVSHAKSMEEINQVTKEAQEDQERRNGADKRHPETDMGAYTHWPSRSLTPYDALMSVARRATSPFLSDLPPSALIFLVIFGGSVLAVLGAFILEGRFFCGGVKTFAGIAEQYPLFQGLEEKYNKELAPWLAEQERNRIDALRVRHVVYLFGIPAAFYCLVDGDLIAALFMVVMAVIAAEWEIFQLKRDIKPQLTDKLCQLLGLEHTVDPGSMDLSFLEDMRILPEFSNNRTLETFTGSHGDVRVCVAKTDLIASGRGMPGRRASIRVFSGAIIQLMFPQPFEGRTTILRDRGRAINTATALLNFREHRVGLGRKDLEKVFEGFTSNDAEAEKLLTPEVLEALAKLSLLFYDEINIQAGFSGPAMCMALDGVEQLFHLELQTPLTAPARICRFAERIAVIYSIIDLVQGRNRKVLR